MKRIMAAKKIVLAYSGGLDTSVILKWLQDEFGYEVICYAADLGQAEELTGLEEKAKNTGASKIYIEDLREEFVRDYVFPAYRADVAYEGIYLLGTSLGRPLIAKKLIEDRAERGGRHRRPRRDRQGQRPGALRAHVLGAEPQDQDRGPVEDGRVDAYVPGKR